KFFTTLKKLITKPGVLSLAFVRGERMRYLDPIRMYIFTSFLFFLIFFSFNKLENISDNIQYNGQTELQISQMDSAKFSQFTKGINKGKPLSREEYKSFVEKQKDVVFFESDNNYKSVAEFDS